jgi:putative protein-disulfide isomerase
MTARIQQAYYREARNPSENETLVELAAELGLDALQFTKDLNCAATKDTLMAEIKMAAYMQVDSMPGLVLKIDDSAWPLAIDYVDANSMLEAIEAIQQIQPAD